MLFGPSPLRKRHRGASSAQTRRRRRGRASQRPFRCSPPLPLGSNGISEPRRPSSLLYPLSPAPYGPSLELPAPWPNRRKVEEDARKERKRKKEKGKIKEKRIGSHM